MRYISLLKAKFHHMTGICVKTKILINVSLRDTLTLGSELMDIGLGIEDINLNSSRNIFLCALYPHIQTTSL